MLNPPHLYINLNNWSLWMKKHVSYDCIMWFVFHFIPRERCILELIFSLSTLNVYPWRNPIWNSPCLISMYLFLRVAIVCSIWDHMIMESFLKLNSLLLMKLLPFHCQLLRPCLVHTLFSCLLLSMGMFIQLLIIWYNKSPGYWSGLFHVEGMKEQGDHCLWSFSSN